MSQNVPGYTDTHLTKAQKKNAKRQQRKKRKQDEQTALKELQVSDENIVNKKPEISVDDAEPITDSNVPLESKTTTTALNEVGQVTTGISNEQQGGNNSKNIQNHDMTPIASTDINNKNAIVLEENTKDEQLEKVETALQTVGLEQADTVVHHAGLITETVTAELNVQEGNELHEDHDESAKRQKEDNYSRNESKKSRWDQGNSQGHQQHQENWVQYKPSQQVYNQHIKQQQQAVHQHQQQQAADQHAQQRHQNYPNTQQNYSQGYEEKWWGEYDLSKELVRIVRHGSYRWIKLDNEGYASVDQLLHDRKFCDNFPGVTLENIKYVVDNNQKKRFELKDERGFWFIKATQGHTVKVQNLALDPVTDAGAFPNVVHGTSLKAWQTIQKEGLKRMTRTHIHFAVGMPDDEDVLSGMRNTSDVVIVLDLEKALNAGLKFFISSNRVILSEGDKKGRIHPKFFQMAVKYYPRRMLPFEVPPDYNDKEDEKEASQRPHGTKSDGRGYRMDDQKSRPRSSRPSGGQREHGGQPKPRWNEDQLLNELGQVVLKRNYRMIDLDNEGYASVDQILGDNKFCRKISNVTLEDIKNAVHNDKKKHYELKTDGQEWFIKAAEGHQPHSRRSDSQGEKRGHGPAEDRTNPSRPSTGDRRDAGHEKSRRPDIARYESHKHRA